MYEAANPAQVAGLAKFFKTGKGQYGEGDLFLGIKVPVTRAIVTQCWKETSFEDIQECITSQYHEIRLSALLCLVKIYNSSKSDTKTQQECIDFYLSHTAYVNNWDLVDLSCYELLGKWLLNRDRSILYNLAAKGTTIWEQRIGISAPWPLSAMVSWMTLMQLQKFSLVSPVLYMTCCRRQQDGFFGKQENEISKDW